MKREPAQRFEKTAECRSNSGLYKDFQKALINIKAKINTRRNNLLIKLADPKMWGTQPHSPAANVPCFSIAGYAWSMYGRAFHSKNIDVALNDTE